MRHTPIDPEVFRQNRARLRQMLKPGALAVINANDVLPTNADGSLRLVPGTDLFYVSGLEQEQTIFVLCPEARDPKHREMLFLRKPDDDTEVWEGHKLTKEEARAVSGIHGIFWLDEFERIFHRLICESEHIYLNANEHPRAQIEAGSRETRFVAEVVRRYPLHNYHRLAQLMHRLRVVKAPAEVELVKRACAITRAGFERAARFVKPGVYEHEVEAEFAHEFIRQRGAFAYTPIIASGRNACALHYIANDQPCREGDLLLLDVGASYANYNSDLTRTIPVNGKFMSRQKQVYNAVLRVLRSQIKGLAPGKLWNQWQEEAERAIEHELLELELLKPADIKKQDPDEPAFKKYFMHGVGHPLGLDVHDLGLMKETFAPGWVMTVEPGIYIPEEGFAVRLENDVLITENGTVDLMADIPVETGEIEELMNR